VQQSGVLLLHLFGNFGCHNPNFLFFLKYKNPEIRNRPLACMLLLVASSKDLPWLLEILQDRQSWQSIFIIIPPKTACACD
jgi:hypothetical protein